MAKQKKTFDTETSLTLLQKLAHTTAGAFGREIPGMLDRLKNALLTYADSTIRSEESRICMYRYAQLHRRPDELSALIRQHIAEEISQEVVNKLSPTVQAPEFSLENTQLVSLNDMELSVQIGNQARVLENHLGDILSSLNLRLSVLLKTDSLSIADNPFRPEVFLRAIGKAWEKFDEEASEAKLIILRMLTPNVFINMNPVYQLINDCLIAEGVLPQHIDTYRRERTQIFEVTQIRADQLPSSNAANSSRSPHSVMASYDQANAEAQQSLMGRLQRLLMGAAGQAPHQQPIQAAPPTMGQPSQLMGMFGSQGVPTRPMMVDASVIQFLTNLQHRISQTAQPDPQTGSTVPAALEEGHPFQPTPSQPNVLHQLRNANTEHPFNEIDTAIVDLLAHVFDFIFRDRQLPPEIKFLIGQLQIPTLKAALLDKDFFFSEEHPARKLINLLGKAGVGWIRANGMEDPLYVQIADIIIRVQSEFNDDLTVFEGCLKQLENFLAHEEERVEENIEPNISEQLLAENQKLAYEAAHREIQFRKASGEVSSMLNEFLDDMWLPVLANAYMNQPHSPVSWPNCIKIMDDLIWSVQPKTSVDERTRLLDLLPVLVKNLNDHLDQIAIDFPARTKFMANLVERHAAVVRYAFKLSATHQLKHAELMARRAVHHRIKDSKEKEKAQQKDAYDALVNSMARGIWLEYQRETPQGLMTLNYRLTWISPMRSRFLFTNRQGYDAIVKTPEELSIDLRNGHANVLDGQPILDRAIESAVEELETSQAA